MSIVIQGRALALDPTPALLCAGAAPAAAVDLDDPTWLDIPVSLPQPIRRGPIRRPPSGKHMPSPSHT